MELLQHHLQLLRDREPQVACVLKKTHALIGQVEENHRCPKHAAGSNDLRIQHMADPDQQEDQYLAADPLKADLGRQLVIRCRTHHPSDIIDHHEEHERIQQSIAAAKEIPR